MTDADWIKATKSGASGQCVEMRPAGPVVQLQDSKVPGQGLLALRRSAFAALLHAAQQGELDHLI